MLYGGLTLKDNFLVEPLISFHKETIRIWTQDAKAQNRSTLSLISERVFSILYAPPIYIALGTVAAVGYALNFYILSKKAAELKKQQTEGIEQFSTNLFMQLKQRQEEDRKQNNPLHDFKICIHLNSKKEKGAYVSRLIKKSEDIQTTVENIKKELVTLIAGEPLGHYSSIRWFGITNKRLFEKKVSLLNGCKTLTGREEDLKSRLEPLNSCLFCQERIKNISMIYLGLCCEEIIDSWGNFSSPKTIPNFYYSEATKVLPITMFDSFLRKI